MSRITSEAKFSLGLDSSWSRYATILLETSGRESEEVSSFFWPHYGVILAKGMELDYNTFMEEPKLLYRNITVSGKVGTGKNTLVEGLKPILTPLGWRFFSGGEFMRQYVAEHKLQDNLHHKATDYNDEIDRMVDSGMKERLQKEDKLVLESWLSGYMAQRIAGVLKVLLYCSSPAVVIDRLVNRDHITVEEAKRHLHEREDENFAKWKRLYGDHDFWDPELYDLVIDTFSNSREEVLRQALEVLGYPLKSR